MVSNGEMNPVNEKATKHDIATGQDPWRVKVFDTTLRQSPGFRGKVDPDNKFPPTDQQQDIVETLFTGDDIVVRAAAGAGKTSTLQILACRVNAALGRVPIVYIVFNTSVQAQVEVKIPSNVEV
jgi:superfamily II DNA or RNA helicase